MEAGCIYELDTEHGHDTSETSLAAEVPENSKDDNDDEPSSPLLFTESTPDTKTEDEAKDEVEGGDGEGRR